MKSSQQLIQQQVDAYNQRDLQAFTACFHQDISLYNFGESTPYLTGMEALTTSYRDVFEQSPDLHASITHRIVLDQTVIDHEKVTGRKGIDFIEVVVIYQVEGEKIKSVTYVRK